MDLMKAMTMAAKGMQAQGVRMRVISENLANADTTSKTEGGDPYRRQVVTFKNQMDRKEGIREVTVNSIGPDKSDFVMKYNPSHPSADSKGYVKMPNVNTLVEMMDMREAQRSYEANLGVIEVSKSMLMRTIDMIRA